VLSAVRGVVAILVVVAAAGCADESIRIDTAMLRALDDRVIDVFTTSACGDIRVEVDEDDDEVTLRAYYDTPAPDASSSILARHPGPSSTAIGELSQDRANSGSQRSGWPSISLRANRRRCR